MKDHEIIAKIGALLDGADAPTRATVEAWLRAKYAAPAPAVTLAPALAKPATVTPAPQVMPPPAIIPFQPRTAPPWEPQRPWPHGPWWTHEVICHDRPSTATGLRLAFGVDPVSPEEADGAIASALATVSRSWPEDAKAAVVETAARLLTGSGPVAIFPVGPGPRPESDDDGIGTLFIADDTGIRVSGKRIHLGPRPASYG